MLELSYVLSVPARGFYRAKELRWHWGTLAYDLSIWRQDGTRFYNTSDAEDVMFVLNAIKRGRTVSPLVHPVAIYTRHDDKQHHRNLNTWGVEVETFLQAGLVVPAERPPWFSPADLDDYVNAAKIYQSKPVPRKANESRCPALAGRLLPLLALPNGTPPCPQPTYHCPPGLCLKGRGAIGGGVEAIPCCPPCPHGPRGGASLVFCNASSLVGMWGGGGRVAVLGQDLQENGRK